MIRRAQAADLPQICSLFECINPRWTDGMINDALTKECADVLIYGNGGVLGFICVEYVLDEGCITAIAVDKANRGVGIGRQLIKFAEKLRQKRNIYLEVEENNFFAIKLYESCGYNKVGKRKNYYGESAAVIMNKEF